MTVPFRRSEERDRQDSCHRCHPTAPEWVVHSSGPRHRRQVAGDVLQPKQRTGAPHFPPCCRFWQTIHYSSSASSCRLTASWMCLIPHEAEQLWESSVYCSSMEWWVSICCPWRRIANAARRWEEVVGADSVRRSLIGIRVDWAARSREEMRCVQRRNVHGVV